MNTTPTKNFPRVAVLLATHNGAKFLREQLESLFGQQDVAVSVIASDDCSSDGTVAQLQQSAQEHGLVLLPASHLSLGNANRNFMRLIHDAPVGDADYVAFSDQDDIWLPDRLRVAVECLKRDKAAGYSSNVTAFWPDGRTKLLLKSQPQKAHDYFFESAGAGCTFVITRQAFDLVRDWVRTNYAQVRSLRIHDWSIYALIRHQGLRWVIDSRSSIYYRQHRHNELGANVGLRAAKSRFRQLFNGQFRKEALDLAAAIGLEHPVIRRLGRLEWMDRWQLALSARHYRRRNLDALALALGFLITRKDQR